MSQSNCKCGCLRKARRTWYSYKCREQWRNAQRTPDARARYEKACADRKRLEGVANHRVMATVHNADADEITITRKMVNVTTPRLGMFGL